MSWSAVIPIRSWQSTKSRLGTAHLTEAFALDLLEALQHADNVTRIVVTSPHSDVRGWARAHGCESSDDDGRGLNEALIEAAPAGNVAFILADLPCLRAVEIDAVLPLITTPSFIADTSGTGSTSAFFPDGFAPLPLFGPRSRARHRAAGLVELDLERAFASATTALEGPHAERWHRDVDTAVDLWDACRIGVGAHTAQALVDRPLPMDHE